MYQRLCHWQRWSLMRKLSQLRWRKSRGKWWKSHKKPKWRRQNRAGWAGRQSDFRREKMMLRPNSTSINRNRNFNDQQPNEPLFVKRRKVKRNNLQPFFIYLFSVGKNGRRRKVKGWFLVKTAGENPRAFTDVDCCPFYCVNKCCWPCNSTSFFSFHSIIQPIFKSATYSQIPNTIALGRAHIPTIALGHYNGILITEGDSLRDPLFIGGPRNISEFGSI